MGVCAAAGHGEAVADDGLEVGAGEGEGGEAVAEGHGVHDLAEGDGAGGKADAEAAGIHQADFGVAVCRAEGGGDELAEGAGEYLARCDVQGGRKSCDAAISEGLQGCGEGGDDGGDFGVVGEVLPYMAAGAGVGEDGAVFREVEVEAAEVAAVGLGLDDQGAFRVGGVGAEGAGFVVAEERVGVAADDDGEALGRDGLVDGEAEVGEEDDQAGAGGLGFQDGFLECRDRVVEADIRAG